jgi:hypothetical protein
MATVIQVLGLYYVLLVVTIAGLAWAPVGSVVASQMEMLPIADPGTFCHGLAQCPPWSMQASWATCTVPPLSYVPTV